LIKLLELKNVFHDERGDIFSVIGSSLKQYEEIAIITSKKGIARGGCIHDSDEFFTVIEGKVSVYFRKNNKIIEVGHFKEGNTILIPKRVPHIVFSETDCMFIEWGPAISEKGIKEPETLKIVKQINNGETTFEEVLK